MSFVWVTALHAWINICTWLEWIGDISQVTHGCNTHGHSNCYSTVTDKGRISDDSTSDIGVKHTDTDGRILEWNRIDHTWILNTNTNEYECKHEWKNRDCHSGGGISLGAGIATHPLKSNIQLWWETVIHIHEKLNKLLNYNWKMKQKIISQIKL
jgi:hypothetical protein